MKSKEEILETAILTVAYANSSYSGLTENEEVEYKEFCIYSAEQHQLDELLTFLDDCTGIKVDYTVVEEFTDGNGDECLYIKIAE